MKEIKLVSRICSFFVTQSDLFKERKRIDFLKKHNLDGNKITKNVDIHNISNIKIGKATFMNSGQLYAGPHSTITIGDYCAIGYNVHIKSYMHDKNEPTGHKPKFMEKNIIIGDNVWVGDNVYIKEGITIGNNVIIGANSVVTKNILDNIIVAGCPAIEINKHYVNN